MLGERSSMSENLIREKEQPDSAVTEAFVRPSEVKKRCGKSHRAEIVPEVAQTENSVLEIVARQAENPHLLTWRLEDPLVIDSRIGLQVYRRSENMWRTRLESLSAEERTKSVRPVHWSKQTAETPTWSTKERALNMIWPFLWLSEIQRLSRLNYYYRKILVKGWRNGIIRSGRVLMWTTLPQTYQFFKSGAMFQVCSWKAEQFLCPSVMIRRVQEFRPGEDPHGLAAPVPFGEVRSTGATLLGVDDQMFTFPADASEWQLSRNVVKEIITRVIDKEKKRPSDPNFNPLSLWPKIAFREISSVSFLDAVNDAVRKKSWAAGEVIPYAITAKESNELEIFQGLRMLVNACEGDIMRSGNTRMEDIEAAVATRNIVTIDLLHQFPELLKELRYRLSGMVDAELCDLLSQVDYCVRARPHLDFNCSYATLVAQIGLLPYCLVQSISAQEYKGHVIHDENTRIPPSTDLHPGANIPLFMNLDTLCLLWKRNRSKVGPNRWPKQGVTVLDFRLTALRQLESESRCLTPFGKIADERDWEDALDTYLSRKPMVDICRHCEVRFIVCSTLGEFERACALGAKLAAARYSVRVLRDQLNYLDRNERLSVTYANRGSFDNIRGSLWADEVGPYLHHLDVYCSEEIQELKNWFVSLLHSLPPWFGCLQSNGNPMTKPNTRSYMDISMRNYNFLQKSMNGKWPLPGITLHCEKIPLYLYPKDS